MRELSWVRTSTVVSWVIKEVPQEEVNFYPLSEYSHTVMNIIKTTLCCSRDHQSKNLKDEICVYISL